MFICHIDNLINNACMWDKTLYKCCLRIISLGKCKMDFTLCMNTVVSICMAKFISVYF